MAFQPTPADVSVIITSPASAQAADAEPSFVTERRITPTWTVMQVKGKLETMTGIPPGSQRLRVKVPGQPPQWAECEDRLIGEWGLAKGSEIEVGLFFSVASDFPLLLLWNMSTLSGLSVSIVLDGYASVTLEWPWQSGRKHTKFWDSDPGSMLSTSTGPRHSSASNATQLH